MTVLTRYLGETLVWTFRDDSERTVYLVNRARREHRVLSISILSVLFAGLAIGSIYRGVQPFVPATAGVALAWELFRLYIEQSHGLTAIQLRLHPKRIMLTEIYGEPSIWRNKDMVLHASSHIKAMHWANAGCHVMFKGTVLLPRPCVLPMGLFSSQESIDVLYRWAEVHKITIDGVPPLPGGYVRPIEERRGL